jgi:hypothetical protein
MKTHLMFADADFDGQAALPAWIEDLERDLDLPTVYAAMAAGDTFLHGVARAAIGLPLTDADAIAFRQRVLCDCLAAPEVVRQLYDLAVEAITREKKFWMGMVSRYPATILHRSIDVIDMFVDVLRRVREIAEAEADRFSSDGFRTLFAMLADQLSDDYLAEVRWHVKTLGFRSGVLLSARLGAGNKGGDYVLRTPWAKRSRLSDLLHGRSRLAFTIADRDEAGHRALSDLRDRGINLVADAAARSVDHILSFFTLLRTELGFYVGCLNLHQACAARGAALVEPRALPPGNGLRGSELYDLALALSTQTPVVGNTVDADGKNLIVITGANKGGKSTFLKSMGLAYLLMQAGMNVPATAFRASVATSVFTHFTREEDENMDSGRLDEEMARMSAIAENICAGGLLLCNESFASTNEREGSQIARQIVTAMVESGIRVQFVTHLYDLSHGLYRQHRGDALFLRAERGTDGSRSFRLTTGEPLPTSYGPEVYARIFGETDDTADRVPPGAGPRPRAATG